MTRPHLPHALPLLLASALPAFGCVSTARINEIRAQAHAQDMATETDPDVRAWLQGWYDCGNLPVTGDPSTGASACYGENEARTVATLREEAKRATGASERDALLHAASCVEAAKAMPYVGGGKHVGDYAEVKACLTEKRRAVTMASRAEDDDFTAAAKAGTPDAWLAFIEKHRDDQRVPEAAKHVVDAAATSEGDAKTILEEKLAATYPPAVADLPPERRILLVGPKGLRVRDVIKLQDANVAPSVVVARVKASTEPYKSFDGDELAALKKLGVADDVVTAMIEVTTKVHDQKKADDDREALRAELATLRAMIEEKQKTGQKGGETVQTKEGPMDVLVSCGKRLAAMKLCEQVPFPASTLCESTAKDSFPCPDGASGAKP